MKIIKGWKLFLAFSFFTLHGFAQKEKTFVVPLKSVVDSTGQGYKRISINSYRTSMNYDASRHFTGIPTSLKEMIVKEIEFQPEQSMYEFYLRQAGSMPAASLMEGIARYHTDTLQLSRHPTKHMVFLVSGIDSSGTRVLLVDANNNLDFSDDKLIVFDSGLLKKPASAIVPLLPVLTVQYQYALNGSVYNKSYNLKITPVSYYKYADPLEEKLNVVAVANEAKEGSFASGKKSLFFSAQSNSGSFVKYDSLYSTISVIENDASGKVLRKKEHIIGDTISLDENRYIISRISVLGDSLKLSYVGKGGLVYGIDSGKVAYDIQAIDLDGHQFNLQKYRGKYVLIDFWGTWCKPCVASIPDLVSIANEFKNDVQVVSIAVDQPKNIEAMKEMINSKGMNWIHIFQDLNDASKAPVANKFKVHVFPTQILVDPNGAIVLRTTGDDKGSYISAVLKKRLKR